MTTDQQQGTETEDTKVATQTSSDVRLFGDAVQTQEAGWRPATWAMGYTTILGALVLFAMLAWMVYNSKIPELAPAGDGILLYLIQHYGYSLILFGAGVFLTLVGMQLIGKAGKGTQTIIPPDDRVLLAPLIAAGKKDSIDLYVTLSSLGGFTGTFQKIGFTGLPLATAILTLIFAGLSFLEDAQPPQFLELAKLTLGAFIGSFVQKGTDIVTKLEAKTGSSASGGKPSNANTGKQNGSE
jgi:hypothetical protein